MNDKILSLLGLCKKANKLIMGNDTVTDSIMNDKARLVLFASDISRHTLSSVMACAQRANISTARLDRTKEELSTALGKYCAVVSICDKGFAQKLSALIGAENSKEE